eukprot:TRINITY_DN31302_c0_g1_i1.p1 TRINITY_DN31302_c0_g1~~TRINITY_DN31302_c0_g1_i1.p1  ORF type:complete len:1190 (+),score=270.49 TRINITY_DN31302_c0_g1_i1:51-3572(+)
MVRTELLPLLGEQWRRGLRRLGPESLVRGALLLARTEQPPEAARLDITVWPESRRQRLEGILGALPRASASAGRPRGAGPRVDLSARDWTGLLWAAARCRVSLPEALATEATAGITEAAVLGAELQASDVARCFWASATVRSADLRLLDGARAAGLHVLQSASPQDLSNVAWASATLRYDPEGWIRNIATHFARHERFRTPQSVANVLWSLARAEEGAAELHDESARDKISADSEMHKLLAALGDATNEALLAAEPQHVANILWAYARLAAIEEHTPINSACARMAELLPEASTQHVANAVWASARLDVQERFLLCAVSDFLHQRVRTDTGAWQRRWEEYSLQHVSMICWSFAKSLKSHAATRRVLRDAVSRIEDLAPQGVIKQQELSNLLWAYAEAAYAWAEDNGGHRPAALLSRVVRALCESSATMHDRGGRSKGGRQQLVGVVAAASALSKLYAVLDANARSAAERWMLHGANHALIHKLDGLKPSETAALLRSLSVCRALRTRLLLLAIGDLVRDNRFAELTPEEVALTLDVIAGHGRVPAHEIMNVAHVTISRLNDFSARHTIAILSPFVRLAQQIGPNDLAPLFLGATAALCEKEVGTPPVHGSSPKHAALQASGTTDVGSELQNARVPRLSPQEWAWMLSAAAPLRLEGLRVIAPPEVLARLVSPFAAWLQHLLSEVSREASALASPDRSASARSSDVFRYRAAVARGPGGLGPRWNPVALRLLGVRSADTADVLQEAQRQPPAAPDESPSGTTGAGGQFWLRARLTREPAEHGEVTVVPTEMSLELTTEDVGSDTGSEQGRGAGSSAGAEEEEDLEEDVQEKSLLRSASEAIVSAPGAQHSDASQHMELLFLRELLSRAGEGEWTGTVFLYAERPLCLSCLGAVAQLRSRWPAVQITVACGQRDAAATTGGSAPSSACEFLDFVEEEVPAAAAAPQLPLEAAALEAAIRSFLREQGGAEAAEGGRGGTCEARLASVGLDPEVQRLWAQVTATPEVRQSGKRPGRKRDWQDKLKYFIHHRVGALEVVEADAGGEAKARLVGPPAAGSKADANEAEGGNSAATAAQRAAAFRSFVELLERSIAELLAAGKGRLDAEGRCGFVAIEELASRAEVASAWRELRLDSFDRLAYFLRHTDSFEVWLPPRGRGIDGAPAAADVRSRVRVRPP